MAVSTGMKNGVHLDSLMPLYSAAWSSAVFVSPLVVDMSIYFLPESVLIARDSYKVQCQDLASLRIV
jgi:hypothetical protein